MFFYNSTRMIHSIKIIFSLLGIIFLKTVSSQNLVPNPSFEEVNFDFCGLFPSAEKFEASNKYWTVPTRLRPEIYSQVVNPSCWNYISGRRLIPKTGKRTASILISSSNNTRSYLQVLLKEKLQIGKIYYTEVFISLPKNAAWGCNNFGLYFSDTLIRQHGIMDIYNLNFKPQVNHSEILSDTTEWTSLRGEFKATTNASYLLIGNFFDSANTKIMPIRNNRRSNERPIVFIHIDDVYVGENPP